MIGRLKALIEDRQGKPETGTEHSVDEKHIAAAALLIEAARMDEDYSEEERVAIERVLGEAFDLDESETQTLHDLAIEEQEGTNQLFRFTHTVKNTFSEAERIELVEMLWEVVYADGERDHLEDNLMRRISGLIYVSDRERGRARKRVMDRLGLT